MPSQHLVSLPFFFTDTATTEIYTLSLHDALPISERLRELEDEQIVSRTVVPETPVRVEYSLTPDRKSTRLNSSHSQISYAVFCLKKKKKSERRVRGPRRHRFGRGVRARLTRPRSE